MSKRVMLTFCMALMAPVLASAQGTSRSQGTPMPVTEKGQKERAVHMRMAQCHAKAKADNLTPGTDEFKRSVTACLKG
jgi:hypothetical protein